MHHPAPLRLLYVLHGQAAPFALPATIGAHRPCEWQVIHITQRPDAEAPTGPSQQALSVATINEHRSDRSVHDMERQLRKWATAFDLVCLHGHSKAMQQAAKCKQLRHVPKLAIWEDAPEADDKHAPLRLWAEHAQVVQIAVPNTRVKEKLRWQAGIPVEWIRTVAEDPGSGTTLSTILEETFLLAARPAERPYQQCSQCVLDTKDDSAIRFDEDGKCNYCHEFERNDPRTTLFAAQPREKALAELVERIKQSRKHPKYDCILGVSGGVDSSFLALKLKELGLTPLLVHVDNGYNSAVSESNVRKLADGLGFDLDHHVLDWEEFKNVQLALFKASVIDIEMLSDHVISAHIYALAQKLGINFMISGHNHSTEGVLPTGWYHDKRDLLNIRSITWRYSHIRIKKLPVLGYWKRQRILFSNKFESVRLLNYLEYDSALARAEITEKVGWQDYGGKHTESIFTRFYQQYILPEKFGVDKRKAHYASMICSGGMQKEQALLELGKPLYAPQQLQEDKDFVRHKLGLSEAGFEALMALPLRKHTDFPSYINRHYRMEKLVLGKLKPVTRRIKGLKRPKRKLMPPTIRLAGTV